MLLAKYVDEKEVNLNINSGCISGCMVKASFTSVYILTVLIGDVWWYIKYYFIYCEQRKSFVWHTSDFFICFVYLSLSFLFSFASLAILLFFQFGCHRQCYSLDEFVQEISVISCLIASLESHILSLVSPLATLPHKLTKGRTRRTRKYRRHIRYFFRPSAYSRIFTFSTSLFPWPFIHHEFQPPTATHHTAASNDSSSTKMPQLFAKGTIPHVMMTADVLIRSPAETGLNLL